MKLHFESKIFSLKGRYYVYDDNGGLRYSIVGRSSWTYKYSVIDQEGKERIRVIDKPWSFKNRVRIEVDGVQLAEIVERFSMKKKMDIENLDWHIEASDVWGNEFTIIQNDRPLAYIENHIWSMKSKMDIEIFDETKELYILGVVLAIVISNRKAAAAAT